MSTPEVLTRRAAIVGPYRYHLARRLRPDLDTVHGTAVVFVMLNPSTADHRQDDQTVRRCLRFTADAHAEVLHVVNLYAYRTPWPSALVDAHLDGVDLIGDADRYLHGPDCPWPSGSLVVAAWGARPSRFPADAYDARIHRVLDLVGPTHALAVTADGSPRHPSRLPNGLVPEPWC